MKEHPLGVLLGEKSECTKCGTLFKPKGMFWKHRNRVHEENGNSYFLSEDCYLIFLVTTFHCRFCGILFKHKKNVWMHRNKRA